jgi:hypothetical protein
MNSIGDIRYCIDFPSSLTHLVIMKVAILVLPLMGASLPLGAQVEEVKSLHEYAKSSA